MQTWVLVVIVYSAISGKPVLGPSGVTSISGYTSAVAYETAGAALTQNDARGRLEQDAKRPLDEPDRFFVKIDAPGAFPALIQGDGQVGT